MSDPVLVVMKPTRIRGRGGRVITLTPGLKSEKVSDRIKSALPEYRETMSRLKAKGRIIEDTPPWS